MVLDKEKIADILEKRFEHLCCTDCINLRNKKTACYDCVPRWSMSRDYAREIADLIVKKGLSEQ